MNSENMPRMHTPEVMRAVLGPEEPVEVKIAPRTYTQSEYTHREFQMVAIMSPIKFEWSR